MKWVTGFAGTGKTAILHSVAERYHQEGLLAATFFSSSSNKRDLRTLIPTIVYQLYANDTIAHSVGKDLTCFFSKNPDFFEKSLESQADRLLRLFKKPGQRRTIWPKVIIIDGFDQVTAGNTNSESFDREQKRSGQRQALSALLKLVVDEDFPFRIIIGSRQDTTIVEFMNRDTTREATTTIDLNLLLGILGDDGIGAYMDSKFEEIRQRPGFTHGPWSVRSDLFGWPHPRQRDTVVLRASGYFFYASCVASFIENESKSPQALLEAVVGQNEQPWNEGTPMRPSDAPFLKLDAMYTDILNSCTDTAKVVTILKIIHTMNKVSTPAHFWIHFFESSRPDRGLANGCLRRMLEPLRCLMTIPAADDKKTPFIFCHSTSLFDYLSSPKRCQNLGPTQDDCLELCTEIYWDIVEGELGGGGGGGSYPIALTDHTVHAAECFRSASPQEQGMLLHRLFDLFPFFETSIPDATPSTCNVNWWTDRCIELRKADHIRYAFQQVHIVSCSTAE
jgi:hypothetical protein